MRLSVTWLTVLVSACRHLAARGQLRAREIGVPIMGGICAGICPRRRGHGRHDALHGRRVDRDLIRERILDGLRAA